jgi:L-glyceraldehyde 3-phosphate reductase
MEDGLLEVLEQDGIGCIVFSPLAQGLLTDRYLHGVPEDSRAAKPHGYLRREAVTNDVVARVRALNDVARERGQSLAQMALAWVLRHPTVTSALVGASRVAQIEGSVAALANLRFADDELAAIDAILTR